MTKVVLIEDDIWLRELEASVLKKAGYTVIEAGDGLTAIDVIDAEKPDVIIVDVLLAGSTAFALLHELQTYNDTNDIPIIMCTNLAEQFDAKQLNKYGVRRVVDKSTMHPDDLVAAVKAVTA